MKRLFVFILIILLTISAGVSGISSYASADSANNAFDESGVLEDLQSADGFDIRDYPYNETGTPRIINFVEYCYSPYANLRSHYAIYLYIYNPSGKEVDTASSLNAVQIAVSYGEGTQGNTVAEDYDKFTLKFCSVSGGNYANLLYKFKVVDKKGEDGKTIAERVNSHERRYDVSGFELFYKGENNAREFTVGGTYTFTGYAKGYGPDGNTDSLTSSVTDLETVKLEIHHASYLAKTGSSVYDQLHSVYFSVPRATIERYGEDLQEIKAEWYEYKTDLIAVLLPEWEARFRSSIGVAPAAVSTDDYMIWRLQVSDMIGGEWVFNYHGNGLEQQTLHWLLPSSEATEANAYIPSEDLLEYMRNYTASYANGKVNGKYSADLFEDGNDGKDHKKTVKINADDGYSLMGTELNGFNKFLNWISGYPTSYPSFEIEKAIEPLKDVNFAQSDSVLSSALYINEQEIAALRAFCTTETAKGNSPYLFRYAVRDYEVGEIRTDVSNWVLGSSSRHIGFGAKESVFLDFDIIYLKFFKDGNYYVVPTVSSPVDAIGGLISPEKSGCQDILSLLITLALLLVLLIILAPILPYIIKGIVWIISLPFKAIKAIVNACKKKKE